MSSSYDNSYLNLLMFWTGGGGSAVGRGARGPYGILGGFWGHPRRILGSQQADGMKPKRLPNEVGGRLEEETAETCVLQHF